MLIEHLLCASYIPGHLLDIEVARKMKTQFHPHGTHVDIGDGFVKKLKSVQEMLFYASKPVTADLPLRG